ncbi:MAG: hypothetical protein KBB14_06205 [Thermoanaerobaculia bacterium]|nr:hypothetical protein [Thermoanaerobaculia bacterium]
MLEPLRPRRPFLVALAVSTTLAAATGRAALDAADALLPWTELTEADALASTLVRKAVVDGRTVHYPTPTRELAVELEARAATDGRAAVAALRHLAEARRELGDLPGAEEALARWAGGTGGAAWAEAAHWGALYRRWPFAFASARAALASDAPAATKRALATERIAWADEDPSRGDPLALRAERAALFPDDAPFVEEWIRALEKTGRLDEADAALRGAKGLPEETRLLVLSDLKGDHGDREGAYSVLEAWVADPHRVPSRRALEAFSRRADAVAASRMESARLALESRFDPRGLTLLARWFEGKGRADLALELLAQVELRHEEGFARPERIVLARLYEALDAVPEAFRSRLAGAAAASADEAPADLAALARLAFAAGSRPIAWGALNDEPYRWAARADVTPGFTTAGLSFLLTGLDPRNAQAELEAQRLPEKTLRAGRLLLAELERRKPDHAAIPALHVTLMERLVSRGKGSEALALLPRAESGDAATRAEARRVALLAMRQAKTPLEKELPLWKERLALLAPDGSVPGAGAGDHSDAGAFEPIDGFSGPDGGEDAPRKERLATAPRDDAYDRVLTEALSRLDDRDRSHRASVSLLLGEMDRLPGAERVWLRAVDRLSGWKLDDELEPRYRKAIAAFEGPEWWKRFARWYARRQKAAELKALGEELAASFRASEVFARDPMLNDALVALEEQPNPFVTFSDFLALRTLQRFPASPAALDRAEARLLTRASFDDLLARKPGATKNRAVVDAALLATRRDAVLFADDSRRSRFLDALVKKGELEAFLRRLEEVPGKTPVENVLLLDGWARLSRFERAVPFAEALCEAYPGSATHAAPAIALERSLSAFSPDRAAAAGRIAARAAAAAPDPSPFLTPIGEMWQDLERPEPAGEAFRGVLAASPRNPDTILEVATAFWDYGRFAEAWQVLDEGRKRLDRPALHAFEAGVLKEELRDRDGALAEYLAALSGEWDSGGRARRRLARLAGRPVVRDLLLARIDRLAPGNAGDETALASYLPLATLSPAETSEWDDWIDLPRDPVGRADRAAKRETARPAEETGAAAVGTAIWRKAREMAPRATSPQLLAALRTWSSNVADARWAGPEGATTLEGLLLEREAALLPSEEARIPKEATRIDWLLARGRAEEATAAWAKLLPRVEALPDGATKIRALATRARFLEAAGGDAAGAFRDAVRRFPWSLGLVEDQVAYCLRSGRDAEGLDALESAAGRAAAGHREPLTRRLVGASLERKDLPRARRAAERLLAFDLPPSARVDALALSARLAFREGANVDPFALATTEAPKLPEALRPDLWAALAAAARDEGRLATGVDLYVEALNRRTDRSWLEAASRLAVRAGKSDDLLAFFRKQRQRSPRDVRWAVAVREVLTFRGDLDGAVAAAREAIAIAPEREELYAEAVALLERQGRFRDAADVLAGRAKSRPADEGIASSRAALHVRAGDVPGALAVERAAIAAVRTAGGEEGDTLAARQTVRAARRFLRLGRANAAWELAAPGGDPARCGEVPLGHAERTEIALRAGAFPKLFARFASDDAFLEESAWAFSRNALPEQREAAEKEILARVFLDGGRVDERALTRLHAWAESAGIRRLNEALSRRLLAAVSPAKAFWGADPPADFVASLDPIERYTTKDGASRLRLVRSDFHADWIRHLVARDDLASLRPALAPLVDELHAKVTGPAPVTKALPWAGAFPVDAFARLAALPENSTWRKAVETWLSSYGAHQRFLAATGRSFDEKTLLPLLTDGARRAWFVRGGPPTTPGPDEASARTARNAAVDRAADALWQLVSGDPAAAASADVARLRGPRTVGELLGKDPRFVWSELAPKPGDRGDDLVTGSGVDTGRVPARIWGTAPAAPWFVLESLARLRERGADAPLVPLESASRGGEALRAAAAVRTAQALGDLPLALSLDEAWFTDLSRAERFDRRLRLLVAAGGAAGKSRADALLRKEVRNRQAKASEPLFRAWERSAAALGLTPPLANLDPSVPVDSGLLALLCDRDGPAAVASLKPADVAEYRGSLGGRWSGRVESLSSDRLDYFLREVWVNDGAPFPLHAASRLDEPLRAAAPLLARLDAPHRAEGLLAVRALPDSGRMESLAKRAGLRGSDLDLLLLDADLRRGDDASAIARLTALLEDPSAFVSSPSWEGPDFDSAPSFNEAPPRGETASPLLRAFRRIRDAGRADVIRQATALLSPKVDERLAASAAPAAVWELAFELTPASGRTARLEELERSWARGEWGDRSELVSVVALLAAVDRPAAIRWFRRLPDPAYFSEVRDRSDLLVALHDANGARGEWVAARARLSPTEEQELAAFAAWRALGGGAASAPAWWTAARAVWEKDPAALSAWGGDLARHLVDHPYDRHSARVVTRSLAPAPARFVAPATLASGGADEAAAGWRVARAELSRGARAARAALRSTWFDADELRGRAHPGTEVDGLLADLARIGAATGEEGLAERALSALEDRRSPSVNALRSELEILRLAAAPRPEPFLGGSGRPVVRLLPKDLTWDLYARVLNAEDVP